MDEICPCLSNHGNVSISDCTDACLFVLVCDDTKLAAVYTSMHYPFLTHYSVCSSVLRRLQLDAWNLLMVNGQHRVCPSITAPIALLPVPVRRETPLHSKYFFFFFPMRLYRWAIQITFNCNIIKQQHLHQTHVLFNRERKEAQAVHLIQVNVQVILSSIGSPVMLSKDILHAHYQVTEGRSIEGSVNPTPAACIIQRGRVFLAEMLTSRFSSPYISMAFSSDRPQHPYSSGVNTVVGTLT